MYVCTVSIEMSAIHSLIARLNAPWITINMHIYGALDLAKINKYCYYYYYYLVCISRQPPGDIILYIYIAIDD